VGAAYSGKTGLEIMQAISLACAFEGGRHRGSNYSNARWNSNRFAGQSEIFI